MPPSERVRTSARRRVRYRSLVVQLQSSENTRHLGPGSRSASLLSRSAPGMMGMHDSTWMSVSFAA